MVDPISFNNLSIFIHCNHVIGIVVDETYN